jgi:hypothetical protein
VSNYPYQAFVLTPTFNVKEVTIVSAYWNGTHEQADSKKVYNRSSLYASAVDALAGGFADLEQQERTLSKRLATIKKRRANLEAQSK